MNKFENDLERISELKSCIKKAHDIMHETEDPLYVFGMVRTLLKDVLLKYDENEKFITAKTKIITLK